MTSQNSIMEKILTVSFLGKTLTDMKTRFTKCFGAYYYVKEVKKHWWSRWEVEKEAGLLPVLYKRYYDNGRACYIKICKR